MIAFLFSSNIAVLHSPPWRHPVISIFGMELTVSSIVPRDASTPPGAEAHVVPSRGARVAAGCQPTWLSPAFGGSDPAEGRNPSLAPKLSPAQVPPPLG